MSRLGGRPLPSGVVTFLFTDIEGSTRLLRRLGEDAYSAALDEHHSLLRSAFDSQGGHELGTEGDSFFVAFASPSDAVSACLDAQSALHNHAWAEKGEIRVRMGLHSGMAIPTDDGRYVALAVHQAARIAAAGHGGQVLVSSATAALIVDGLPPGSSLLDLGRYRLKDFDEPQPISQLASEEMETEFPPLKALAEHATNLPKMRTSFVGRDVERREVTKLLEANRLVTVVGPGGAGKTRLAVEVAADIAGGHPDGAWITEFQDLRDGSLVAHAVGASVGVADEPGRSHIDIVVDGLRRKRLVLVLDNCEHLVDDIAGMVDAILTSCPDVTVLATSREPLGVQGEHVWRLPELATPGSAALSPEALLEFDAVRLFIDRAAAARNDFVFGPGNAASVGEICKRLDGIPLAIELAAARVRSLSPQELARRLDDRFRMIVGSDRRAVPRQQTLRALIDWSYGLLSDQERTLLARLSVFASGFTVDAAEAVGVAGTIELIEVLDLLTALVDKSLVIADHLEGPTRYRILETIQQFAAERLDELGMTDDACMAHLRWCRDLAASAGAGLVSPQQAAWLDRCEIERANFRVAMEWASGSGGDADTAMEIGVALHRFWVVRGPAIEGYRWLENALQSSSELTSKRAWAHQRAGSLAGHGHDTGAARRHHEAALALARQLTDRELEALALDELGQTARAAGDLDAAVHYGRQAVVVATNAGDTVRATCLCNLAGTFLYRGRHHEARSFFEEALPLLEAGGDEYGVGVTLANLAVAAYQQGDLQACRRYSSAARKIQEQLGDARGLAMSLNLAAQVETELGNISTAEPLASQALSIFRDLGNQYHLSIAIETLAEIRLQGGGDPELLLEEKLALDSAIGFMDGKASALSQKARLLMARSEPEKAAKIADGAVAEARSSGNEMVLATALSTAARIAAHRGQQGDAGALIDESLALWRDIGHPRSLVRFLEDLAGVLEDAGETERAAALRSEAALVVDGVALER